MVNYLYSVVDIMTGEVVGSYKNRKRASRKADKLDMEYGAVRYVVRMLRLDGLTIY